MVSTGVCGLDIGRISDRRRFLVMRPSIGVAIYPVGISLFRFPVGTRRGRGGRRGKIRQFSPSSRRRLRSFLLSRLNSSLVSSRRIAWVTLTSRSGTAVQLKTAFRTVVKRLRRRYRRFVLIWRLEYQRRGIPHFHILVISESPSVVFAICRDLVRFWVEITDSSFVGQNFKWVRSISGLALYITDMGKLAQSDPGDDLPGRWWGVINPGFLSAAVPVMFYGAVFYVEGIRFVRSLRLSRARRRRKKGWRGRGLLSEFFDVDGRFVEYLISLS